MTKFDIEKLSQNEKLELMSLLWDSLDKSRFEISSEQKAVLDKRLDAFDKGTMKARPWEEVEKELCSKYKSHSSLLTRN